MAGLICRPRISRLSTATSISPGRSILSTPTIIRAGCCPVVSTRRASLAYHAWPCAASRSDLCWNATTSAGLSTLLSRTRWCGSSRGWRRRTTITSADACAPCRPACSWRATTLPSYVRSWTAALRRRAIHHHAVKLDQPERTVATHRVEAGDVKTVLVEGADRIPVVGHSLVKSDHG